VAPTLDGIDWHLFLARPRIPSPPPETLHSLAQQSILLTGAGGSIAASLALRLANLPARQLTLLEASESHLFSLQRDLRRTAPAARAEFLLGSVADRALLEDVFASHAPRLIFHAAAFKHVPLLEEQPLAAIANNIFGTQQLVSAATEFGARVVLVSTDKAVEPTSVMGATKRVAEQIVLAAGGTVQRLANVLASRDSVVEVFASQLAEGGPLTVTDPAARRFFVTVEEAVNLLLAAALQPPEPALFVPSLPQPQFVAGLARFLAQELAPGKNIELAFTRLRPGDKESEQLWSTAEQAQATSRPGLLSLAPARMSTSALHPQLAQLHDALSARDVAAAVATLCRMVPGYTPSELVQSLVGKAGARVMP